MAVVWKLTRNGVRYEVRSAGRTLRLYTNGAFHTQFNPARPLPGGVWDLLALPALIPTPLPRSALVLGVGGGAVIRLLEQLGVRRLTGIELDDVHLEIARRFFGCDTPGIDLVHADATRWVRRDRHRFDLVIDDLYLDGEHDPERPQTLGSDWHDRMVARLSARGVLVQNHLSVADARRAASTRAFRKTFRSALVFERDHYDNAVLALFRETMTPAAARAIIDKHIRALGKPAIRALDYGIRRL